MDDSRMEEIFAFIDGAEIELDPDPIRRGPKYLNNMVAECRNLTNTVQKFEREVAREKMAFDRQLNRLEASYDLQFNELMAHDPHVLKKTSVRDREAAAKTQLVATRTEISDLNRQVTDLGHVETVIKSKLRELKEINKDIRLQMRLIEDEIQLGNYWGDQSEDGQHHITSEEIDVAQLEPSTGETIEEDTAQADFEAEFGSSMDANVGSVEDYEFALDQIDVPDTTPPSQRAEIDYEDLLKGL